MKAFEKIVTLLSIIATFALLVFVPVPSPELNEPLTEFITYALLLMGLGAFVLVTWTEDEPTTSTEMVREIPVTDFNTLDISDCTVKLLVTQGEVPRVTLRGSTEQLNRLHARQEGPAVVVSSRAWFHWLQHSVSVTVTVPSLRLVDLSGASVANISGFENFRHLLFDVSGACNLTFNGRGERLTIESSGASKLTLKGHADRLDIELTGASSLTAKDFEAAEVNIDLSGACSAQVLATKHLHADLSGASSLRYRGQPVMDVHHTGASSVSRY